MNLYNDRDGASPLQDVGNMPSWKMDASVKQRSRDR